MEVNGRFWGSLQLAIDAGVDFPSLWVAILNGQKVEVTNAYAKGLTLRWLWGDVKRLLLILAGPPPGYTGFFPTVREGIKELFGPQPEGTRLEMWQSDDPGPAVGEWLEGVTLWSSYDRLKHGAWEKDGRKNSNAVCAAFPLLPAQSMNAEN